MLHELLPRITALGVSRPDATAILDFARAGDFPTDGASARLEQLHFGVSNGIVTEVEAAEMLQTQPELLCRRFAIAAESPHIVCAAKPHDVLLSPDKSGAPRWAGEVNLRDWLRGQRPTTATDEGEVRLCHNLDFATSGVIVAATSREAANDVSRCFRERLARKLYCALVLDHPTWDHALWDWRIQPSTRRFKQRISGGGKKAETHVSVAARGRLRVGEHAGRDATFLWLEPRTGRRHQLRLHCSHAGHPIVGDYTYANDRLCYRTFLHAAALELPLEWPTASTESIEAAIEPSSWSHFFEAQEEWRTPEGWPTALDVLDWTGPSRPL